MGSCGAKTSQAEVIQPQNHRQNMISQVDFLINDLQKQYSQFLRLDHPLNVNLKYTTFFTVIPEQFTGIGIRKTNAYSSRLSRKEWEQKKEEFWETRIEGNSQCWQAIKLACDADEQNTLAILAASELKLVKQSFQILYDNQGHKYDIPIFCINEPISFPEQDSSENGLKNQFENESIEVTIRSIGFQKDFTTQVANNIKISDLKSLILEAHSKFNLVRLFYNGREIHDHHSLGQYKIVNKSVVQAQCKTLD